MHEAKTVAVNVVAWNSMAFLPQLFLSLDTQTVQDFTTTVIDNASNDGVVAWLQTERPGVAALRNFRNQGCARAHNQAATLALTRWPEEEWGSRYLLIMNPDVELAPDAIEMLVGYLDANPDIMACGPKILRARVIASEEGTRETDRLTLIDSTGLVMRKTRRHRDRGAGEEDRGQYDHATNVFGLSGVCMMLRASAVPKLLVQGELFDGEMFASEEDVDLMWRMQRFAMPVRYVPQAVAWHHCRGGLVRSRFSSLREFFRNKLKTRSHAWLLIKNDELGNIFFHLPWILPYEFLMMLVGLFQPSQWRAWATSIVQIPAMFGKRDELQKRVNVSGKTIRRLFV